jgi:hypothetical protein
MDDISASDAAIDSQVFGPFATVSEAKLWARIDRAKHCTLTGNEAAEVFWEEKYEVGFGEFVYGVKRIRPAKIPKKVSDYLKKKAAKKK